MFSSFINSFSPVFQPWILVQSFCNGACLISLNPFCSLFNVFRSRLNSFWSRVQSFLSRFCVVSARFSHYQGVCSCPRSLYDFFFVVVFTYFYSFTRFASCLWLCLLIHSLVLHSRLIVFLRYRFSFDSFSCCKIVLRSCKLGMHSYSLVYNRGYVLVLQFFVHSCVQFTIAVFHRFVL